MISFRAVQNESGVLRWVKVKRDGVPVTISTCTCAMVKPGGVIVAVTATAEVEVGLVRLNFGTQLDQAGVHHIEVTVNGEKLEEPVELYVRPLFERGPR